MYRDCQKCNRAFFSHRDDDVLCVDCRGDKPAKRSGWLMLWLLLILAFFLWRLVTFFMWE